MIAPRSKRCLAALAAAVVLLAPASGRAQGRRTDPQAEHLRAAQSAEKREEWDVALAEYQTAHLMGPNIATYQGIAKAHYELGHTLAAFDAYTVLATILTGPALGEAKVQERLAELSAKIGLLVLTVQAAGADVTIDGEPAGKAPLLVTRRLLAGPHKVAVLRPDAQPIERELQIIGGATTAMTVADDAKIPTTPPPATLPSTAPGAADAPPAPPAPPEPTPVIEATPGEVWTEPHGSKVYHAVRITERPKIDGDLDEAVWQIAPRDSRFLSTRSKPYGRPSTEPTSVQVAYDDENLYVAFRSTYGAKRDRDDSFSSDELGVVNEAESVAVLVDPLHSHSNALMFAVTRAGARADLELSEGGDNRNDTWRGIWDVATRRGADEWTAEFRIPWGTMRMPSADGPSTIGIQFRRREPVTGEAAIWAAQPPATIADDTNYFGHLDNLTHLRPEQRLYLQPYFILAVDQTRVTGQSVLTDLSQTGQRVRGFGGLYARYQPPGPLRFDGAFNPTFVGSNPDQALTNFDRFELEFPEARQFFAEDTNRFQFGGKRFDFGDLGTQLFYSRRIGLRTNTQGLTEVVPMLYGVKSVLRDGGTEAALMNVGLSPNRPGLAMNDNISVGRFSETFSEGRRVGAMILGRTGSGESEGNYLAGGVDGTLTLFDRHFALNGFLAQSKSSSSPQSGASQVTADWLSQDYYASIGYVDIGNAFDAQLGYFPITGVRSQILAAGYTPVIHADLVQQVLIESQLTLTRDRGDQRVYDRGVLSATVVTLDQATFQVQVLPAIEQVADVFPLANGRINVAAGRYDQMSISFKGTTSPRRVVVAGIGYIGGDLFGGQLREPSASLGLNLGRFTSTVVYHLFLVDYGGGSIDGHQVSAFAAYAFAPLAKTSLVVETNSFTGIGVAQLITSYTFGALSTVALVVRASSGSTLVTRAESWLDNPNVSAFLSFAYGISPF